MVRVKRGNVASQRKKKYFKYSKGYRGLNSKSAILASEQVIQSFRFAYISRRLKKRDFRSLWIGRINSACRALGINYSKFIGNVKKSSIYLDRKILSTLAFYDPKVISLLQNLSASISIKI